VARREKRTKVPDCVVKLSAKALAIQHARTAANLERLEFFHDRWNEAYVTIPVKGHFETWKIESQELRSWVERVLYKKAGSAPTETVKTILNEFRLQALYDGPKRDVHIRVTEESGVVSMDMCDDSWRVIEITSAGWSVVNQAADSPIKFRRSLGMDALPEPEHGGNLRDLVPFLNISKKSEILLLSWLTYSLRPSLPSPILALQGVQGSGKSTATRILRSLLDPSLAKLSTPPRTERDLIFAASNARLIALDNLSHIDPALSNALCRIATGGAYRERKYFTNDGSERLFTFQNPIIVNGIEELPERPDLLDRCILIHMEAIAQEHRKDEETLKREFKAARPKLFGALLDTVSAGLNNLPNVSLTVMPRMADFAKWGIAVEKHLRYPEGSFIAAYEDNIAEADAVAVEASPVARLIYDFLSTPGQYEGFGKPVQAPRKKFIGTALFLLQELKQFAELHSSMFGNTSQRLVSKHPKFPKAANQLSNAIASVEPNLKKLGVAVERGRNHQGRYIQLELVADPIGAVEQGVAQQKKEAAVQAIEAAKSEEQKRIEADLNGHASLYWKDKNTVCITKVETHKMRPVATVLSTYGFMVDEKQLEKSIRKNTGSFSAHKIVAAAESTKTFEARG
jgi:putative DNA primase/helicase